MYRELFICLVQSMCSVVCPLNLCLSLVHGCILFYILPKVYTTTLRFSSVFPFFAESIDFYFNIIRYSFIIVLTCCGVILYVLFVCFPCISLYYLSRSFGRFSTNRFCFQTGIELSLRFLFNVCLVNVCLFRRAIVSSALFYNFLF